jgi:putative protein-disulfide isomerase
MERGKIIYVYDALCGWCYGFSPVMSEIHGKYQNELDFEVISGGMITGKRIRPIGEVAPYIRRAYKDVEKATGVQFGTGFLEGVLAEGKAIFNSIPPAVALSVFKTYYPDRAVAFAGTLQKAVYYDGIEPEQVAAYGPYAEAYGIPAAAFTAKMQDESYQKLAQRDFQKSAALEVNGFPSVFLVQGNTAWLIARGYTPFPTLDERIGKLLHPQTT